MKFTKWWSGIQKQYKWVYPLIVFIYTLIGLAQKPIVSLLENQSFFCAYSIIDLVQAFVIFIIAIVIAAKGRKELSKSIGDPSWKKKLGYTSDHEWENAKSHANNTMKNVIDLQICLWLMWFILYMIFTYKSQADQPWYPIWSNIFNVMSSAFIFMLFIELSPRIGRKQYSKLGWFIFPILAGTEFLFRTSPGFQYINFIYALFVGVFSAMAFVLLIEKLGNKFNNIPRTVIYILYGYAIIQALYPFFTVAKLVFMQDGQIFSTAVEYIKVVIKVIALIGKITLFLVFTSIINDGSLAYYIVSNRRRERNVQKDIESFARDYDLLNGNDQAEQKPVKPELPAVEQDNS